MPKTRKRRGKLNNPTFNHLLILVVFILVIGTVFYHFTESFNWLDAFYFSVVSLTTVGYGEMYPVTDIGKVFTVFYLLLGIVILLIFVNLIIKYEFSKK